MKESNLQFKSNLYVLADGVGKLSPSFVSKVSDANTLLQINRKLCPMGGISSIFTDWQQDFINHGLSCSLAKEIDDNFTHGIITENGEKVCVCKCQHKKCRSFGDCSEREDFRRISKVYEPDTPKIKPKPLDQDKFTYDEPPRVEKTSSYIPTVVAPHEDHFWHDYKGWKVEHNVRGHKRRLADGAVTWVTGHKRGGGGKGWHEHHDIFSNRVSQPIVEADDDEIEVYEECEFKADDYVLGNLVLIESAERIIKATVSERILVNGGAGTGKTHTVIERLKYILQNNMAEPDRIMVLCFSRSAVKVIRKRLKEEILLGGLSYDADDIGIRTFDSFATWYLKETDQSINLKYDDYDKRIERFNQRFLQKPEEINDALSYLIVDEIQDLVGLRAEMVKCLLDKLSCGFMLLGDQCQAIYDYQITDEQELNAARFFEWLDRRFGVVLQRYELTRNYRQQSNLQASIVPLRKAMLTAGIGEQKRELQKIIKKYEVEGMSANDIITCCSGDRAILSWSNGGAYRQSQELNCNPKNRIDHVLLGNSRKISFTKEIAVLLSTYQERTLAERRFFELAKKSEIEQSTVQSLWDALQRLDSRQEGFVDLDRVRQQLLWEGNVDDALISSNNSTVTISTIHKAKGKEYDEVLINLSKIRSKANKNDFAEIKVYYVALTRARQGIVVNINPPTYDEKIKGSGRFIKCGNKVSKYELGLDGDINMLSFVDKKLFGSEEAVKKNQEYIQYNVRKGDCLSIWLDGEVYKIFHNDHIIGSMNFLAFEKYKKCFSSGKYFTHDLTNYNKFEDIYVSDIITVVNQGVHSNTAEPYSRSGFWLGVDFCGYSRPREE